MDLVYCDFCCSQCSFYVKGSTSSFCNSPDSKNFGLCGKHTFSIAHFYNLQKPKTSMSCTKLDSFCYRFWLYALRSWQGLLAHPFYLVTILSMLTLILSYINQLTSAMKIWRPEVFLFFFFLHFEVLQSPSQVVYF
jgi:hypothetical protein